MASPLLPYANAHVLVQSKGAVTNVNGRFVAADGPVLAVKCFMKRMQYASVSSGSTKQPLSSQLGGNMMPGASGDQFYYRGYALQTATVTAGWEPGDAATWVDVTAAISALRPGNEVTFWLGATEPMQARVERNSGIFGGAGIDEILYAELGGVELQLVGAEVLN